MVLSVTKEKQYAAFSWLVIFDELPSRDARLRGRIRDLLSRDRLVLVRSECSQPGRSGWRHHRHDALRLRWSRALADPSELAAVLSRHDFGCGVHARHGHPAVSVADAAAERGLRIATGALRRHPDHVVAHHPRADRVQVSEQRQQPAGTVEVE